MKKTWNDEMYEIQADFCRAIAHPRRLKMLELLREKPRTVTEMADLLDTTPPNISQHLKILMAHGILERKKNGVRVLYSLSYPELVDVEEKVREILAEVIRKRGSLLQALKG